MSRSVNVLAMVREEHRYVFLYDDNSVETLLTTLAQHASDPELDFTWYDAALMAQRVRSMLEDRDVATSDDFPYAA